MRRCALNLLTLLALLLPACAARQDATQTAAPTQPVAASAPTLAPAPKATAPPNRPTSLPTPGPGQFANPVIDRDFPDPDTLKVGDTYYAYATNTGSTNVQVARSKDLVHWEQLRDALPVLPAWAGPNDTWAPDVSARADGNGYLLYFTARSREAHRQCIGVATSDKPEGPFRAPDAPPLVCPIAQGGAIDPSTFTDEDGTRYLLWKNDGNCCGGQTWIYLQRVSADGLTLEGAPAQLITADKAWEGILVEAPTLWKHAGKYYLFYSANAYNGLQYAVGYAVADTITGPYTKAVTPLLKTDLRGGAALGPGGQDIVVDAKGQTWLVYHSWNPTVTYRRMQIDRLTWDGDKPRLAGPTRLPQPVP